MDRALYKPILKDLEKKVVLLAGPRQCGKTTLSKMFYDNYDYPEHRTGLLERSWDRNKQLIIFDELHKM